MKHTDAFFLSVTPFAQCVAETCGTAGIINTSLTLFTGADTFACVFTILAIGH